MQAYTQRMLQVLACWIFMHASTQSLVAQLKKARVSIALLQIAEQDALEAAAAASDKSAAMGILTNSSSDGETSSGQHSAEVQPSRICPACADSYT